MTLLPLAPIMALLLAPAVAPVWLRGWREGAWLVTLGGCCLIYVLHLLPDLDGAGAMLGAASLGLALPTAAALSIALVSGWSWRAVLPLIVVLGAALAAIRPAVAADPAIPPEILSSMPSAGWLVAGVAILKWLGILGDKGIVLRVSHDLSEDGAERLAKLIRRVEVYPAPTMADPDPALSEPSGAQRRPRR